MHTFLLGTLFTCTPILSQGPPCLEEHLRAFDGEPSPGGGQLMLAVPEASANTAAGGRVAFVAQIAGPTRNQAVFVSDGTSLRALAFGCGGSAGSGSFGGCGDPAPGGGTFGGFFDLSFLAPSMNDAGDVLFLADLTTPGSPRGLFLYRAATGLIESVARVGDLSPSGDLITAVSHGSLNSHGEVAFLARTSASSTSADQVLRYENGVRSLVAAVGSPGPGGAYQAVSGSVISLPDGSWLPVGAIPGIDEAGRIAFWAAVEDLPGLVLQDVGVPPAWIVRDFEPTPAGGFFWRLETPLFGSGGEIVFSGGYTFTGNPGPTGWFAVTPTGLRHLLSTGSAVGDSTCVNVERSRNPFRPSGHGGSVVLWAELQRPDASVDEVLLLVHRNGSKEVLVEEGDPSPAGGVVAELARFPSFDGQGRAPVSARLASTLSAAAHWLIAPCGVPTAYCSGKQSSLGCTPRIGSDGAASATSSESFVVTASETPSHQQGILIYGQHAASLPFQGGLLCIASPIRRTPPMLSTGPVPGDCSGTRTFDFKALIQSGIDPILTAGATVHVQWWSRDANDPAGFGTGLSDALALTIAP